MDTKRAFYENDWARFAAVIQHSRVGRDGELKDDTAQQMIDATALALGQQLAYDNTDFSVTRFVSSTRLPIQHATECMHTQIENFLKDK
jgi:hypothetical protein